MQLPIHSAYYSNTTNVKVKLIDPYEAHVKLEHSNTTNVKVKLTLSGTTNGNASLFKYNQC